MVRTIATIPEMASAMQQEVNESGKKSQVYKIQSEQFKKAELANDISRAVNAINEERVKVDFTDRADVKKRITDYFTACSAAGVFPSVQGLASYGFGISRQALNQWRNKHRGNDVANMIDVACDMMADILTNQSLHNNANPVQSLFQLKNNHAFADRVEIEPVINNSYEQTHEISKEYLFNKYILPNMDEDERREYYSLPEGKRADFIENNITSNSGC